MTVATAVADVVAALQAPGLTRGDSQPLNVINHDPMAGTIDRPASVSVTFGGMDETDYAITVRLYVDTNSDIASAESLAQTLTPSLDAALDTVPVPRSAWRKTWSQELTAYVVETNLAYPRTDF